MKKYNKGKKILSLFLTLFILGSCCMPVFADTDAVDGVADENLSLQENTEEDLSFDQDNILSITYKETVDGGDITLYDSSSDDSTINSLDSLELPMEIAEITVEFDQNVTWNSSALWIMRASDFERIEDLEANNNTGIPFSELLGQISSDDGVSRLKMEGLFLNYDEEYVVMVNSLRSSTNYFSDCTTFKYVELFRFTTKTPDTVPAGYDEEHPIEIDSAQDLYDIRNDPNGGKKYYVLTRDIDMGELEVSYEYPEGMSFSGVLDGNGHTIKNFAYKSESGVQSTAGLFYQIRGNINNSTCVKDLTFTDVQFGTKDDPVGRSGIFAAVGFGSYTFSNVHITTSQDEVKNKIYTGGNAADFGSLVGQITSVWDVTVEKCTVNNMYVESNGTNSANKKIGALIGGTRTNTSDFLDYDPALKMRECVVSDLEMVINGEGGYAGAFSSTVGNADIENCDAENITIVGTCEDFLQAGGAFAAVLGGVDNQISHVNLNNIKIELDGEMSEAQIGGMVGASADCDYSDIKLNGISIYGTENCNLEGIRNTRYCAVGGMIGGLDRSRSLQYSSTVQNVGISDLKIENIDTKGPFVYAAGFIPYTGQTTKIDNVYVDCTFIGCSSEDPGRFGKIISNYYDENFGNGTATLTVSDTYYNAENGNESNERLNGLFEVTDFGNGADLSAGSSIEATVPVTFDIEVVSDEETVSGSTGEDVSDDTASGEGTTEDGSGDAGETEGTEGTEGTDGTGEGTGDESGDTGETAEPETPAMEPMTNRDSATVSVQAYEALQDEDGNIVKGNKIDSFMEKFGDAVTVEKWKIIPYTADEEGQMTAGSTEGITETNTLVSGTDGMIQADVSSTATVGTEESPAQIVVSVMVNGTERTVTIPYRYVRISSGGGSGGGSSASQDQDKEQKPEITVSGEENGGSTSLSEDGTTLTITPADGYVIFDVTLNGESLGAVSEVKDLETGDEVIVTFAQEAAQEPDGEPDDVAPPSAGFADVADSAWYKESVDFVVDRGLFNGTGAGTFSPQSDMTRAMFVTAVGRLSGETVSGYDHPFADVASGTWYTDSVAWAVAKGIVNGISATEYAPNQPITREQMAVMLYNYAVYAEIDVSGVYSSAVSAMPDASDISSWASEAVAWAYDRGLMTGTDEGRLEPSRISTRAEVAAIFERFVRMTETQTEA